MRQERLNDAAIALCKILSENNVKHGIFGGWVVGIRGGPRGSKDIDCLVAGGKQQVLKMYVRSRRVSIHSSVNTLRKNAGQFSWYYSRLALKRYSHLLYAFQRVSIDRYKGCRGRSKNISLNSLPSLQIRDVQKGLLEYLA